MILTLISDVVTGWTLWPHSVFCKVGTAFCACFHNINKYEIMWGRGVIRRSVKHLKQMPYMHTQLLTDRICSHTPSDMFQSNSTTLRIRVNFTLEQAMEAQRESRL